jgi:outer membrane protein assembly factor BamB
VDDVLAPYRSRHDRRLWVHNEHSLLEFPPVIYGNHIFQLADDGVLIAINKHTGRTFWAHSLGVLSASTPAVTFYSTPAVVYGRVFLGNTDGRVYAYNADTGRLDWAVQTGAYVYASPAVTNAPGLGATVYLGSYDGTFYAINARSGRVSWKFNAHGRISGSATIIGHTVYFADLGNHHTYGLDTSTGRVSFEKTPARSTP